PPTTTEKTKTISPSETVEENKKLKVGDKVKAGQPVGLTGRTGRATTEHCHFECRINGRPFDPAIIFDHLNKSLRMDLITFTKSTNGAVKVKSQKNYMAKSK
ncbi:MAG TPA: M23 family metallopeptidase, partial [Xylanibacter oryzae]|nr:M23 family metallopeptidase [Xylanibacter oryzae]